jgi:pimeloyl-ACP methyl ester carboxylesterase
MTTTGSATFVLVPGAGGHGAYWNRLVPALERRGHDAIAVDIPEHKPGGHLADWAGHVERAIDDRPDVVLVAQSLGGFLAPMVDKPVRMIVFVNAMIPLPGETPDEWWVDTESGAARRAAAEGDGRNPEFDLHSYFLHDLPADAAAELMSGEAREPADSAMADACEFKSWPEVPIKVVVGRDDRFFPADFQCRVAKDRLGIDADVVVGGHLVALANPEGLADLLDGYATAKT